MKRKQKTKRKSPIVRVLLSILLLAAVALGWLAYSIVDYGRKDEKCQADVAIVLGASVTDTEVSPVLRERLNHGIWLYQNGYVDYLILTGGVGEGDTLSEAYVSKQYVLSQGISEEVIFLEDESGITEENLQNAKAIMDTHNWETAIVVSDPLHMKRAMLMAEDYGIAAYSSPTPTSMYRSLRTKAGFLLREEVYYIGYVFAKIFR